MAEQLKIDMHTHIVPKFFQEGQVVDAVSNSWAADWSLEAHLAINKKAGIGKSILSLTAPGAQVSDDPPGMARRVNEYCAELRDENPQFVGFFATLPHLTDVEASLVELKYALDTFNADGVCLFTRYGPGSFYLGNPAFEDVMREMNKRQAVTFVHSIHPNDTSRPNPLMYQPIIDYTHETIRYALDLILSGVKAKFPDIKFILSHAGGTLPYVVERAAKVFDSIPYAEREAKKLGEELCTKDTILRDAESFHFDVSLSCTPILVKALLEFAGPDRVMYGSDHPYAPDETILGYAEGPAKIEMSNVVRENVHNGTAKTLFKEQKQRATPRNVRTNKKTSPRYRT